MFVPVLLALPLVGSPQDAVSAAASPTADETSRFGDPLYVNGNRISDLAIMRYLIYGAGQGVLETIRLQALIDHELEERQRSEAVIVAAELYPEREVGSLNGEERARVEAGVQKKLVRFMLTDLEFNTVYEGEVSSFRTRYPTLELDTEIARAYGHPDWYSRQLRMTMAFDKFFFPGHPEGWPDLTIESVHAGSPEVDLVEDYGVAYEHRVAVAEETGEPVKREDEMMMGLLRDYVIGSLTGLVEVRTATDGIPEELVMTISDPHADFLREVRTDETYDLIASGVDQQQIDDAKLFLALLAAAEDRLRSEELWMDIDEQRALLDDLQAQFEGSIFSMDFLALQGHQFPSVQSFNRHTIAFECFRRKLTAIVADPPGGGLAPALEEYLPRANRSMGLAKADTEVVLISAFDFLNYRWKENGWPWAEGRSTELIAEIEDHRAKLEAEKAARNAAVEAGENFESELIDFDRFWSQMLDLNSEYWDPPMPAEGKMPPMQGMTLKGRFGPQTRNDLDRYIGESGFSKFLTNHSVADEIFFELQPGDIGGPYKGPQGYYIVRVKSRTAPTNPLKLNTQRHKELLLEAYSRDEFANYVHTALAEADVRGL